MIDWMAMVFTGLNVWLLGSMKKAGWLFGMVGNVLWIAYSVQTSQLPLLLLNATFLVLNVRGYYNWNQSNERTPE